MRMYLTKIIPKRFVKIENETFLVIFKHRQRYVLRISLFMKLFWVQQNPFDSFGRFVTLSKECNFALKSDQFLKHFLQKIFGLKK